MRKISIKTKNIVGFWETDDACIVEMENGKKWVCEKVTEDGQRTFEIVENTKLDKKGVTILELKGKRDAE